MGSMVLSSAHSTFTENDETTTPQRAKRIARPAHWKQKTITPTPQAAPQRAVTAAAMAPTMADPAPTNKKATNTATSSEWRNNPSFIMRTLACVCVLNFLLFTVFPENPLNIAMSDETIVTPAARNILPQNQRAAEPTTLYAPAPRITRAQRPAHTNHYAADGELRTPRWLREPTR